MTNNWKLSRKDNGAAVTLPQDMHWTDEFEWSAVAQTAPVYSLAGAVLLQQGVKLAGRPISLSGEWVWHPRIDVETLRNWTDVPGLKMTLQHYGGREFTVVFRVHDKALQAEPVYYTTPETDQEQYKITVQLMTV